MATKYCSTGVLDALLTYIIYANGGGNLKLVVMTSSDVVPTIAGASSNSTGCIAHSTNPAYPTSDNIGSIASSGNNRVLTIAACSCDTVLSTNVASYVCIIADASEVRYATTCTTQSLTAGNKVNIGTWAITVNQPS